MKRAELLITMVPRANGLLGTRALPRADHEPCAHAKRSAREKIMQIGDRITGASSGLARVWRLKPNAPVLGAAIRSALLIAAQIAALWFINVAATLAGSWLHLPIPGNVLGLALLFALFCSGVLKVAWLEAAAVLLVKHLAFFFIPITVGLMDMGPLFALHGVGILVTLVVSAAVGIALCGRISQHLMQSQSTAAQRSTARV